jgi:hypothetical protein
MGPGVRVKQNDEGEPLPFHATAALTNAVGSGSFVADTTRDPMVTTNLTVLPSLIFGDFTFLAQESVTVEWTQGSTNYWMQPVWSDLGLRVFWDGLSLPEEHLNLRVVGGYSAPISLPSIYSGSLGSFVTAFRSSWSPGQLGLAFNGGIDVGYRINVPALAAAYTSPEAKAFQDRELGGFTPIGCSVRSPAEASLYACGIGPRGFSWAASAGATYMFLDNQMNVSLQLGFQQSFAAFSSPKDELTAARARVGAQGTSSTTGSLSLGYQPLSWFRVDGGISAQQPLQTADFKGYRVPFFDLASSPSNNLWDFFLTTSFSY